PSLMDDLLAYQEASLVDPFSPPAIQLRLHHPLPDYIEGAYYGHRSELPERDVEVTLTSDTHYRGDLKGYASQAVRYGRKNNHLRRAVLGFAAAHRESVDA